MQSHVSQWYGWNFQRASACYYYMLEYFLKSTFDFKMCLIDYWSKKLVIQNGTNRTMVKLLAVQVLCEVQYSSVMCTSQKYSLVYFVCYYRMLLLN